MRVQAGPRSLIPGTTRDERMIPSLRCPSPCPTQMPPYLLKNVTLLFKYSSFLFGVAIPFSLRINILLRFSMGWILPFTETVCWCKRGLARLYDGVIPKTTGTEFSSSLQSRTRPGKNECACIFALKNHLW